MWLTLKTIWLAIYGNKVRVPHRGTLTLGFTSFHYYVIYVNHMVQGQPWTRPNPSYYSYKVQEQT